MSDVRCQIGGFGSDRAVSDVRCQIGGFGSDTGSWAQGFGLSNIWAANGGVRQKSVILRVGVILRFGVILRLGVSGQNPQI